MARPMFNLKSGAMKCTIWENESKEGNKYNTFSFQKVWKKDNPDSEKPDWKESDPFFISGYEISDLLMLLNRLVFEQIEVRPVKANSEIGTFKKMIWERLDLAFGKNEEARKIKEDCITLCLEKVGIQKEFSNLGISDCEKLFKIMLTTDLVVLMK